MKIIKRIVIEDAYCGQDNSPAGNKCHAAWGWCKHRGRRFGNGVTFAGDWEIEDVLQDLKEAGFAASEDDYEIRITETSDFMPGGTVYIETMIGSKAVKVISVKDGMAYIPLGKGKRTASINIPTEQETRQKLATYIPVGTVKNLPSKGTGEAKI